MANQYANDPCCSHCGIQREEFNKEHPVSQGFFAKHCNLCLGNDASGKPISHDQCLYCPKKMASKSIDAVYGHYKGHGCLIKRDHTTRDVHRERNPEHYPDLDLNQSYGLMLTWQHVCRESPDERIAAYWNNFVQVPSSISYNMRDIRDGYREAFSEFFQMGPILLHDHVGDASNPLLLGSLIAYLGNISPETEGKKTFVNPLMLGSEARKNPQVAIMEGSYGAGYGPLAYNTLCPFMSDDACGPKPITVHIDSSWNERQIKKQIERQIGDAKTHDCIALIVEIVRSKDGWVMDPNVWKATVSACKKHQMVLIVDEALTAIRCGAPFAHQLNKFRIHGRPDLVLFGKGIRTSGVAIDWKGINIQQLQQDTIEKQVGVITLWQARFTETATPEVLLQSWGTISLARQQNWPQRAIAIGQTLRNVLIESGVQRESISGLHSFIWLRRGDRAVASLGVMLAYAGKDYARWLPLMDEVMTSEAELNMKVFGLGSRSHRRQLADFMVKKGWWHGYCSRCGDEMETGEDREGVHKRCISCFARPCASCEPGDHLCPMEVDGWSIDSTSVSPNK